MLWQHPPHPAVGASAGGLQACERLLESLPSGIDLVVIFVQHLSPNHKSSLAEILARRSEMPVREVTSDAPIQRQHVYVTPPDRDLFVKDGMLRLVQR